MDTWKGCWFYCLEDHNEFGSERSVLKGQNNQKHFNGRLLNKSYATTITTPLQQISGSSDHLISIVYTSTCLTALQNQQCIHTTICSVQLIAIALLVFSLGHRPPSPPSPNIMREGAKIHLFPLPIIIGEGGEEAWTRLPVSGLPISKRTVHAGVIFLLRLGLHCLLRPFHFSLYIPRSAVQTYLVLLSINPPPFHD